MSTLGLVGTFALSGCFSAPILPQANIEDDIPFEPERLQSANIECIEKDEDFALSCERTIEEVALLLEQSGWFSTVYANRDKADLIISVETPVRRPYWSTPGHNPGFFLLSIAIPFWWSQPAGYRIVVTDPQSCRTVEIDTSRTDTIVMWGLAPLLNISPNRSMALSTERESQQIHLQLRQIFVGKSDDTA